MPSLILTVGAVADPSLTAVFRPFLETSKRAQRSVEAAFAGAAKAASAPIEAAAKRTQGAYRQNAAVAIQEAERAAKAEESAATKKVRAHERALEHVRRIRERHFVEEQRQGEQAERAASRLADKRRGQAEGRGTAAMRTFGGYMSAGLGVGKSVGAGLGLDFSIAGNMQRAIGMMSVSGDATRSAATAAGKTATQKDIDATIAAVRRGGDEAKLAYGDIAAGMSDFVAKSSDLETANASLGQMGRLARATGTNVRDLLSAGGDVNRLLDDSPDRVERLMSIMRLTAKQTAMGNVEMPALAKYMGRMESTAFMYDGGLDKNMGILGALAQVSMKGGQSTAAEATRSAAAFARDITKGAALERFKAADIEVFANKEKTALRGPEAIITDFLKKSGGNFADLAKLFQNQSSRAVVLGFENIYKSKGGGAAGLEAVAAEFKRYTTTMTQSEVDAQAKTALDSPEARAQAMQNKIETIAASLVERVLPSFERLAPNAEKAAEALAGLVSFGSANPGLMIVGAITASLAKAALGEAVGKSIAGMIGGLGGIGIGAATIAITAASIAVSKMDQGEDQSKRQVKADEEILTGLEAEFNKTKTLTPESLEKLSDLRERVKKHKQQAKEGINPDDPNSNWDEMAAGAKRLGTWMTSSKSWKDIGEDAAMRGQMGQISGQDKGIDALIRAIENQKPKGPLDVNIVGGMPAPAGPGVDPGGRTDGVK